MLDETNIQVYTQKAQGWMTEKCKNYPSEANRSTDWMVGCGWWGVNWVGKNDSNICSNHSALSLAEQFKRKSCMVVPLTSFCLNYHSRSQSKGFQPNQRPSSCYKYLKQVQDKTALLEHMLCNTPQEQTPVSSASVPPHD